jgi:hypothetical protein
LDIEEIEYKYFYDAAQPCAAADLQGAWRESLNVNPGFRVEWESDCRVRRLSDVRWGYSKMKEGLQVE